MLEGIMGSIFPPKKGETEMRAKELYGKVKEYAKHEDLNELEKALTQDGIPDSLLEYCALLYQPKNCEYYVEFDKNGAVTERKEKPPVPDYLPADYSQLVEHCTKLFCSVMLCGLSGKEDFLKYPEFGEMEERVDRLCLEECMQYFLYYNRLSLRYGQQAFFEKWKDGTALRIVERMRCLL